MKTLRYILIILSLLTGGLLLIGLFLLLDGSILSASADAGILFVDKNGDGITCTQVDPCGLQTGLVQAQNGDTIYVEYGIYTGMGLPPLFTWKRAARTSKVTGWKITHPGSESIC